MTSSARFLPASNSLTTQPYLSKYPSPVRSNQHHKKLQMKFKIQNEVQVPDQQIRSSTKPWLEKADWNTWSCALEEECDESIAKTLDADNLDTRWDTIRTAKHEVTSRCIPLKVTSRHSKPFWCQELTEKNSNFRKLRRKFKFHSNYRNGYELEAAKVDFKKLLAKKASEWMQEKLTFLNHNRGKSFWQNYRTIFKPEESPIGPLKKANGALAITETKIAEELQQAFFEGCRLREQVFDQEHFATVRVTANNLGTDVGKVHLDDKITMPELEKEIKNLPRSTAFDTDNIHVSMLKHFGPKMKQSLLNFFNDCYRSANCPWKSSKVIFI